MSAAQAIKEALWLRKLLPELGVHVSTVDMFCDNQGCVHILKNPAITSRSKHIDVLHHFARERVIRGEVRISYINTQDMVADCMTKPVPVPKFQFCCKHMGMIA